MTAVTADSIFSGITTFAKLPWVQCLGRDRDAAFDIAFIGAPFVSNIACAYGIDLTNDACRRTLELHTGLVPALALPVSARGHAD